MTQLTFDFSTSTSFATGASSVNMLVRESRSNSHVEPSRPKHAQRSQKSVRTQEPIRTGQSLSLYDSGRKEIHHIGDLAKAVIDRYEIVHRRRAARLAREKAAREQANHDQIAASVN